MNALNQAIYTQLAGGTALVSALAYLKDGGTAPAICHLQAPDGQSMPFVVFSWAGGGDTNETPSTGAEVVEFIRVYHTDAKAAGTIDDLVRARMDEAALAVSGYTCLWCQREDDYEAIEIAPNGERTFTMGGTYRIVIT